jgi:hypothetical protein
MVITAPQLRAARALLGIDQRKLAGVELISEGAPSQAAERLTGVKPQARRNR